MMAKVVVENIGTQCVKDCDRMVIWIVVEVISRKRNGQILLSKVIHARSPGGLASLLVVGWLQKMETHFAAVVFNCNVEE